MVKNSIICTKLKIFDINHKINCRKISNFTLEKV